MHLLYPPKRWSFLISRIYFERFWCPNHQIIPKSHHRVLRQSQRGSPTPCSRCKRCHRMVSGTGSTHLFPSLSATPRTDPQTRTNAINKALEPELKLEHEERQALKKLCEEIRSLNSDIMIYNVLLNAVVSDMESNARSPVTRFIERYVMRTAINFICLPGQWSTIPQRGWKGNNEKPCNSARRYAATARGPKP